MKDGYSGGRGGGGGTLLHTEETSFVRCLSSLSVSYEPNDYRFVVLVSYEPLCLCEF